MKRVIYTVIVDGYDRLQDPPAFPGWEWVCFTDGKRAGLKAKLGLGRWSMRPLPDGDGLDAVRRSRLAKLLPHRYLGDFDYSVYIDGNARLLQDPASLLDQLNWPDVAIAKHPFRDTVFEEIDECIRLEKAPVETLRAQRDAYAREGVPKDLALLENNFLLRRHGEPAVRDLMEGWWDEFLATSPRDQLSLPVVAWRQGFAVKTFDQALKRAYFATKAHYRSPWSRWKRSLDKRLGRLSP